MEEKEKKREMGYERGEDGKGDGIEVCHCAVRHCLVLRFQRSCHNDRALHRRRSSALLARVPPPLPQSSSISGAWVCVITGDFVS